jgi:hypothetical protein
VGDPLSFPQAVELAPAPRDVGMVWPRVCLPPAQGAFEQRAGAVQVALGVEDQAEVVEAPDGVRVVGAEACRIDRQRALVEDPGAVQVALGVQNQAEVVEAPGGLGVVVAQPLLADRQGPLDQGAGAVELALIAEDAGSGPWRPAPDGFGGERDHLGFIRMGERAGAEHLPRSHRVQFLHVVEEQDADALHAGHSLSVGARAAYGSASGRRSR